MLRPPAVEHAGDHDLHQLEAHHLLDRRVGGGSIETAAQWKWGDAENAMNNWAQISVNRLGTLRSSGQ